MGDKGGGRGQKMGDVIFGWPELKKSASFNLKFTFLFDYILDLIWKYENCSF